MRLQCLLSHIFICTYCNASLYEATDTSFIVVGYVCEGETRPGM